MSSRSFRRRNNRRRHRQDIADGGLPGAAGGDIRNSPDDGAPRGSDSARGTPEPFGAAPGPNGERGDRQHQGRRQGGGQGPAQQPGGSRHGSQSPRARGRPHKGGAPQPQEAPRPAAPIVLPDCPVCGKQVRELASALTHRIARQPAHFECVLRELLDSNDVAPEEKICYLGGGSFGILEFQASGGATRFVIRKRIQYEEKEAPQEWKKPLQVSC